MTSRSFLPMKPEHLNRLAELFLMQHLKPRTLLLVARRLSRQADLRQPLNAYNEAKKALEADHSFQARLMLKDWEAWWKGVRTSTEETRRALGKWLMGAESLRLFSDLSYSDLCDCLGINPVHRVDLDPAPKPGRRLWDLCFVHGLEDSAASMSGRRQSDSKDGPLFHCLLTIMIDNMDKMPDPFAPGGPFYGVPTRRLYQDGTQTIQRPALVVHSNDGSSRTIERAPEVVK